MTAYAKFYNFCGAIPADVSDVLQTLGVWHSLLICNPGLRVFRIKGFIPPAEQPADVVVISSLAALNKIVPTRPTAVLCTLPASLLKTIVGKIQSYDVHDLAALDDFVRIALYDALIPAKPEAVRFDNKTIYEHIESVSPPSFLDRYQTVQCRINPYSMRLSAHKLAIGYLEGSVSKRDLTKHLNTNLKLAPMKQLLLSYQAGVVRNAVADVKRGNPVERVAASYCLDEFEITYIIQAYRKLYTEPKK